MGRTSKRPQATTTRNACQTENQVTLKLLAEEILGTEIPMVQQSETLLTHAVDTTANNVTAP